METLGDYRSAAIVVGVIIAVAAGVLVALRLRSKRGSREAAAPPPSAAPSAADYLDSSHIISGPLLPRAGAAADAGDPDPPKGSKPPGEATR